MADGGALGQVHGGAWGCRNLEEKGFERVYWKICGGLRAGKRF